VYGGLIKHYIPREQYQVLLDEIIHTEFSADPKSTVTDIIQKFTQKTNDSPLAQQRALIDHCFSGNSMEEILASLKTNKNEWCQQTAALLATKSPISLKVTLQQMRWGTDFDSCMRMEYRMVNRFIDGHDFYEGIRALLIDKDKKPQWQPPTLREVSDAEVEEYFLPLKGKELVF